MNPHPSQNKRVLRRRSGLAAILATGLLGSGGLFLYAQSIERHRVTEEFLRIADTRHTLIKERLLGYPECLYSLRNLFASSEDVNPAEFAATSADILSRHSGINAIQWVPVVPAAGRAEFEASARRQVSPDYAIRENAQNRILPAAERAFYQPILYIAPTTANQVALGLDLAVGPIKADLARAAAQRTLVMTGKINFRNSQPAASRIGVTMACPVFAIDTQPGRLLGFVQLVLRINDIIWPARTDYSSDTLDMLVLDLTKPLSDDPFIFGRRAAINHSSPPVGTVEDLEKAMLYTADLSVGGRDWRFYYAPTAGWISANLDNIPYIALGAGLLFTALLAAYFFSTRRRAELVEQQVSERTAELRHTQRLLEADILKRQSTEAELRESRRQLDNVLRQMPGMVYRFATHTPRRATFVSRGSIEIIGYEPLDLIANTVCYEERIMPEDHEAHQSLVADALARQVSYESEYRLRDKAGAVKWVLDRGQGIYTNKNELLFIEGLAIDITRRKQAENEKTAIDRKLLESQKMESLGMLAGGIAHDFNNLLTTIVGHTGILRLDIAQDSGLQTHLEQIERGALRAAELCQQMLAYAGKGRFLMQCTSLESLVRDTTQLLRHSISKRATLRFNYGAAVPEVEVDATQIRQIIMNLVVNASDALVDREGVITIETGVMRRDDPQLGLAVIAPPAGQNEFACLRVTDTGIGMNAETLAKVFDPFFTTKFAGRGLGLAAVLGIVRSHHGSLIAISTPGVGSTFTLLLPGAMNPKAARESRTPFDHLTYPRSGTVLLIDDESEVRTVAAEMFATFGFKTLTAADGVEGLEVFAEHQKDITLIVLDLTMPRMNGEETLRNLRIIAPQLPVLVMSGYNKSSVPALATDEHVSFLQKPFSLELLRRQVNRILG